MDLLVKFTKRYCGDLGTFQVDGQAYLYPDDAELLAKLQVVDILDGGVVEGSETEPVEPSGEQPKQPGVDNPGTSKSAARRRRKPRRGSSG